MNIAWTMVCATIRRMTAGPNSAARDRDRATAAAERVFFPAANSGLDPVACVDRALYAARVELARARG